MSELGDEVCYGPLNTISFSILAFFAEFALCSALTCRVEES